MHTYRITISIERVHNNKAGSGKGETLEPLKDVFGNFTATESRSIAIFQRVAFQLLLAIKRLQNKEEEPAVERELIAQ